MSKKVLKIQSTSILSFFNTRKLSLIDNCFRDFSGRLLSGSTEAGGYKVVYNGIERQMNQESF